MFFRPGSFTGGIGIYTGPTEAELLELMDRLPRKICSLVGLALSRDKKVGLSFTPSYRLPALDIFLFEL